MEDDESDDADYETHQEDDEESDPETAGEAQQSAEPQEAPSIPSESASAPKRAYCWFHVKKAVEPKIARIDDESQRAEIFSRIVQLQLCQTPKIFKAASRLFLQVFDRPRTIISYHTIVHDLF